MPTEPAAADHLPVICRLCEGRCGLLAVVRDGRLVGFEGDPSDPVSGGFVCDTAERSPAALAHPERLTRPLRRDASGQLVPATWDEALADIGRRLGELRSRHGAQALGLYLGEPVQRSSRTLARSLAVGVGLGTPNILSALALGAGPRLQVTEWMLGQATPLLADVGRAHFVVLLGDDPLATDWGPMHAGMGHAAALRHSRRTKGTKVVIAGPRRTPLADEADQYLSLPPGSEGWFLLGLLAAVVHGDWVDHQYVRDYTLGYDELRAALEPFTVERCAAACGLEPALVSGLALKLSRAAMATVHAGHGAFTHDMPLIGAWAWLALHALTANALRPGGVYAHPGVVDLQLALAAVPTAEAPRTRVGGHPLLLLQAPGTALADEALTPGPGQLRGLVCVEGDPLLDLPASGRTRDALSGLDLLVCLGSWRSPAAEHAHWVLPVAHPWEREDVELLDNILLPVDQVGLSPAVVAAPSEVRTSDEILRELFRAAHPGPRGSAFGSHFTLGARFLAGADLGPWEARLLDWLGGVEAEALAAPPHRVLRGDTNRAEWRVGHPDGRIRLLPPAVAEQLARLEDPRPDPELTLRLRTSARGQRAPDPLHHRPDQDPGVAVHPDLGLAAGSRVRVETRHGRVVATVRHDDRLRADTVDLPRGFTTDAMALLAPDQGDPVTGTPCLDGLACRVTPA